MEAVPLLLAATHITRHKVLQQQRQKSDSSRYVGRNEALLRSREGVGAVVPTSSACHQGLAGLARPTLRRCEHDLLQLGCGVGTL